MRCVARPRLDKPVCLSYIAVVPDEKNTMNHYKTLPAVYGDGWLCSTVFDALPVGVLVTDSQGQHIFANQCAAQMTGYSIEELLNGVWMVDPDDTEAVELAERALREGTSGQNYETRIIRKDGSAFWTSISWNPVRGADGKPAGLCTILSDISDRRSAQNALDGAIKSFQVLSTHTSDIFSEWDLDGTILYVSPSIRHLGYEPEDLVGMRAIDLVPAEDRPISEGRLQKILTDFQPLRHEVRVVARDGSVRWLEAQVDLIIEHGRPVRIYCVHRDVTERKTHEEELHRANERYRLLAENASDLLWSMDLDGTITYVSPAVRQLGYEPEDWIGHHPFDFIFPEEHAPFLDRMSPETINTMRSEVHPLHIRCKDGSSAWLEVMRDVVRADGVVVGIQGTARNITERKKAEDALREGELRYKSIVESSNDMIMLTDTEGKIVYASPACREISGYEPEELVEKSPWIVHSEDNEMMRAIFLQARRGIPGSGVEYRIITKHGEIRWVSHSWSPIMDGDFVQTVVSIIRDVTARKQAEEALRLAQEALEENEQKYKSIVENSKDVIMVNSHEGAILYISPALRDMLGYEPEEFIGSVPAVFHPDDQNIVEAAFARAANGESESNFEYRQITKSGQVKWVSHAWSPVYRDGKVQAIISVVRDITERKESDERLRTAHEELEHAYQLQREFLNNVTHEVRTPLTAVQGYTEMLLEGLAGPVSDEQSALLGRVMTSSEHLLDVLNAVLQIARMKSGRIALRPRVTDPRLVVEKCVAAVLPQARKKGLALETTTESNGTVATYDEEKLTIIVTNLLGNAVKFTPSGSVEVRVAARPGGCEIVVADTGVGISDSALAGIFDEFSQLDYPGKHKPSGFGLGLSIVAAMVEAIGASLVVSTKKGIGSAFTLSVPALEA